MRPRPQVKGWCPGAYRPMQSGDGLIARVRPVLARLTVEQAIGLCDAALKHGSGIIDLTSRANLQLRGVTSASLDPLIADLDRLGLLDADPSLEGRRNLLVQPLWTDGDLTDRLTHALLAQLADLPDLPPKMGIAIDTGPAPILSHHSADFRFERAADGSLILRADGSPTGQAVAEAEAIDRLIDLANWFTETGGAVAGRMSRHLEAMPLPPAFTGTAPAAPASLPEPGLTALGPAYGVAFGQIEAAALARLLDTTRATALRVSPNRLLLLEGGQPAATPDFITDPADPLRRVEACPGAPFCPSSTVETRQLARRLAPLAKGTVHVSGCAKGCAHAATADVALVGRGGAFDLVRNGAAWDAPIASGLSPETLPQTLGTA
ncbi:cobalamin biosynthesis protein CobG [Tabrizicola sp. J26]|uniref:cobalamin biosynthesis protein CobG n=1 Tax=Alitabrizicola rongguiensis TaxID=2909234 RepID=UPI001F41B27A|nr:cobalamin biosynthesis protein CobG [Tabrizicola rongguiensis]MCF1710199.1 cobalamin biosynthesis protein CobG [Tabrizicola rongguiensis]